jgi:Ca2+-transporting ATPase
MSSPTVRVVRDGQIREMNARDLVPGDLVKLETGSVVPADCRIVESVNLRIQEAALTGESEPVEKFSDPLEHEDLPLGDRKNMGYMGTFASYGRGGALVVATGMHTELGKIASLIQNVKNEETPLQKKLDRLGKTLALAALSVAVVVALTGVFIGNGNRSASRICSRLRTRLTATRCPATPGCCCGERSCSRPLA